MLTSLHLRSFKSWQDTGEVELRPITGFFGPNSSGKTSLLQALLLLKQTSDASDRGLVFQFGDQATPVNLGSFSSVIHGHETDEELGIALEWESSEPFEVRDTKEDNEPVARSTRLGFSVRARQAAVARATRLVVEEMCYGVGDARFGMRRETKPQDKYDIFAEETPFKFSHSVGRPWPLPAPVKCYGFPDQARAFFRNAGFVADLELALEERLRNIFYLGPLRAYPERQYTWNGAQPIDMGRAGESAVHALLASQERGETICRGRGYKRLPLEEYTAQWLKKLGLIHDFRVRPLAEGSQVFEVKVRKLPDSAEVLITDAGFGVSQILPVLVLCFYVPEGSTVILEQPEIHLHPAVQAGLADILIEAWKTRKVQILLESHSEYLLRRLLRRVAEEEISNNDDVGLYFCSPGASQSNLTALELNRFGNIANWPQGFFGDEFGEIAATSRAARKLRLATLVESSSRCRVGTGRLAKPSPW